MLCAKKGGNFMIIDFQDKLHSKEYIKIDATIAPENHKLKVAAYARVSSNSQDQLNSFSVQVQYYTNYIEKNNNWQFVDIYADEGISGTAMTKRSEFLRMIEDCRNGKIEKIITKSTSRFSRNLVDSLEVLRELKMLGVSVYFEKEGLDTQLLSGENLLTLYSLFAQEESISISQNCKKGIRMKMSKGQYVASTAPYGYRLMNKQLEIEPTEAEIVKKIFQDYISGKGLVVIAKELNQQAVPGKRRNCIWRDRSIALILRNERYIGDMLMQKTFAADVIPYNRHQNKDVLPKYYVSNTHQGIVSKVQFEVANMMLQNRSQRISRNRQEYVLSKKIICGECGTVYRRRKTNGKIYWVCRQHDADKGLCKSNRVAETKIFEAFIRMYNKLRGNYKMILLPMIKSLHKTWENLIIQLLKTCHCKTLNINKRNLYGLKIWLAEYYEMQNILVMNNIQKLLTTSKIPII